MASQISEPSYKERVRVFYDKLSPHFRDLWGEHVHDGYYETGTESKEAAQENLVRFLAEFGDVPREARGLDIGCGMGATSVWLAKHRSARMTGFTLSPIQANIARELAGREGADAEFHVGDIDAYSPAEPYDFAWMMGVLGHFENQEGFVRRAARLVKPGGRFVLADWVAAPELSTDARRRYVDPVLKGMLMPDIATLDDYVRWFSQSGFEVASAEDITRETAATWDEGVSILQAPRIARMALEVGREAIGLLSAVRGMREAMAKGFIRYGILSATRV